MATPPDSPNPVLQRLVRVNPLILGAVVLVLTVAGLLIGGPIGGLLLLPVVLALAWILVVSWPMLSLPERALRFAIVVFIASLAFVRTFPQ